MRNIQNIQNIYLFQRYLYIVQCTGTILYIVQHVRIAKQYIIERKEMECDRYMTN